jgi:hypothetical protein
MLGQPQFSPLQAIHRRAYTYRQPSTIPMSGKATICTKPQAAFQASLISHSPNAHELTPASRSQPLSLSHQIPRVVELACLT